MLATLASGFASHGDSCCFRCRNSPLPSRFLRLSSPPFQDAWHVSLCCFCCIPVLSPDVRHLLLWRRRWRRLARSSMCCPNSRVSAWVHAALFLAVRHSSGCSLRGFFRTRIFRRVKSLLAQERRLSLLLAHALLCRVAHIPLLALSWPLCRWLPRRFCPCQRVFRRVCTRRRDGRSMLRAFLLGCLGGRTLAWRCSRSWLTASGVSDGCRGRFSAGPTGRFWLSLLLRDSHSWRLC